MPDLEGIDETIMKVIAGLPPELRLLGIPLEQRLLAMPDDGSGYTARMGSPRSPVRPPRALARPPASGTVPA